MERMNPFTTGNITVCKFVKYINTSSKFYSKSEAYASELLENIEEMYPRY